MKDWTTRLRYWIPRHRVWSSVVLIALLVSMGSVLYWTVNLVRFGLPPPTGQDCGSIIHSYGLPNKTARADGELQSLTCFWQAYQTCKAATISQTYAGTDAGYTDTLTIELRANRCVIYGQEEDWVNTDHHTETFLCAQLSKEGDTLQVAACDGNAPFTLVPRYVTNESYPCGIVGTAFTKGMSQQIEACFFAAYQHCLADSMGYKTVIDGVQVERNFYIENHCGIAYRRGSYTATCASLELHADGLHFLQCGADGDLFIPSAPQ